MSKVTVRQSSKYFVGQSINSTPTYILCLIPINIILVLYFEVRAHCTNSGCGKRGAYIYWELLALYQFSVVNALTQLRDLINSGLARWRMVLLEPVAESGKGGQNPVSKYQIQLGCGELAGWRGTGLLNPTRRDQTLRRERRQGNFHFLCLADHKQDWQPYPIHAQSAERNTTHHTGRTVEY